MKKLSSKMKILLVLAICAGLMVPTIASAASKTLVPNTMYPDGVFERGHYTLELSLTGDTTSIGLDVVNGNGAGKNVVSSVIVTLLDGNRKKREIIIPPDQFSQRKISNVVGTIFEDSVSGLDSITLDLKVAGPKNSNITLTVTEFFENGAECPWWNPFCN